MKKNIIIITLVIILGSLVFIVVGRKNEERAENTTPTTNVQQTSPTTTSANTAKNYTLKDIASHKDSSSCWTAINGNVYDLTSWINQHPGGPDAILSVCGTDGSTAFNDQHGGQNRPQNELQAFLIGNLSAQ